MGNVEMLKYYGKECLSRQDTSACHDIEKSYHEKYIQHETLTRDESTMKSTNISRLEHDGKNLHLFLTGESSQRRDAVVYARVDVIHRNHRT